jgi:hypothetical protein
MATPGVPGDDEAVELPCGETVDVYDLDLGMREFDCACNESHAVVMDVHPLGRFVPEFLVEVLRSTVDTADEFDEFKTAHLMGVVMEEFPDEVVAEDRSEDGRVGYAMLWLTDFDSRRLHEIVVELLVELMEHAISHADDEEAASEFEQRMLEFDVEEFVTEYRSERDLESEHDSAI